MVKKIEMIVEYTNTGFSAYSADYPVFTTGADIEELKTNMLEALNLYFEDQDKKISEKDIKVELDLEQFFDFYKVINAAALSERIDISRDVMTQYVNGSKKPSSAQTKRILNGLQQIDKELSQMRYLV